jgi:hypothetical protein
MTTMAMRKGALCVGLALSLCLGSLAAFAQAPTPPPPVQVEEAAAVARPSIRVDRGPLGLAGRPLGVGPRALGRGAGGLDPRTLPTDAPRAGSTWEGRWKKVSGRQKSGAAARIAASSTSGPG